MRNLTTHLIRLIAALAINAVVTRYFDNYGKDEQILSFVKYMRGTDCPFEMFTKSLCTRAVR